MAVDLELEQWRRQWQGAPADIRTDLQLRVRHAVRRARIGLTASIAVTLAFGAGIPAYAAVSGRLDVAVLAVGVWVMLLAAWTTSITLSRGTWRPAADTTAAFLEFSILSCRRRRQAIAAAVVLYAVMLAFVLTWKFTVKSGGSPMDLWTFLTTGFNLIVWSITLALGALALWRRRVLRRELDNLQQLARIVRD